MKFLFAISFSLFQVAVAAQDPVPFKDANGKWGYKNSAGLVQVPAMFDTALAVNGQPNAVVSRGRKETMVKGVRKMVSPSLWGVIDLQGQTLVDFKYSRIQRVYEGQFLLQLAATGKYGLFNHKGMEILPAVYDKIYPFGYGQPVTAAMLNGKYGFVNRSNQAVIPFEYDEVGDTSFARGQVIVFRGHEMIKLSKENKVLPISSPSLERNFQRARQLTGQYALIAASGAPPPLQPYDSVYQKALANAANTAERLELLNGFHANLLRLALPAEQASFYLEQKVRQLVETDFYTLYRFYVEQSREGDKFAKMYSLYKLVLTDEQMDAINFYLQYNLAKSGARVENRTTGVTEAMPVPEWKAGIPRPGYGWGKTVTSDKIREKVAPLVSPGGYKITETMARSYVGHYYQYTKPSPNYNPLVTGSRKVDRYVLKVVGLSDKGSPDHAVLRIRYTCVERVCSAVNDELEAEKLVFGDGEIKYQEFGDLYVVKECRSCNGVGTFSTGFSHTNDYQYTLGVKVTYSGSYTTTCKSCGGAGRSTGKSPLIVCL